MTYSLITYSCSGCGSFPCACKAPRTERCACGGYLTAGKGEHAILAAVREHNATPQHRAWRRWQAAA